MTGTRRALFLDRDGVVSRAFVRNGKPYPPRALEELEILPGVKEALEAAGQAGLLRLIVTNQPDVARGTLARDVVELMHDQLRKELPLDDILVCWHDDPDQCVCRKPKPGLLIEGAKRHSIDLKASYLVGDRWRDIEAGVQAGCRTIFIDYGYDEKRPTSTPDFSCKGLTEAVAWIGQRERG